MKNRMNQRSSHGRTENKSDSESRSDQPHPSCTIFICGYIRNIGLCCRDIPPHGPRYYTGEEKHRQGFCRPKIVYAITAPNVLISMMGRLPIRSDQLPRIGEKISCMKE